MRFSRVKNTAAKRPEKIDRERVGSGFLIRNMVAGGFIIERELCVFTGNFLKNMAAKRPAKFSP